MTNNDTRQIVNKAWNFAHVLRDDGLRQCILQQPFEGKRVPQGPTDEPASVLLERLKGEAASRCFSDGQSGKRQDAASTGRKRRAKS